MISKGCTTLHRKYRRMLLLVHKCSFSTSMWMPWLGSLEQCNWYNSIVVIAPVHTLYPMCHIWAMQHEIVHWVCKIIMLDGNSITWCILLWDCTMSSLLERPATDLAIVYPAHLHLFIWQLLLSKAAVKWCVIRIELLKEPTVMLVPQEEISTNCPETCARTDSCN